MASLISHDGHGFASLNSSYCRWHSACAKVGSPQSEAMRAALLSTSQARVIRSRRVASAAGRARRSSSATLASSGRPGSSITRTARACAS
jgi:hypothetical protein